MDRTTTRPGGFRASAAPRALGTLAAALLLATGALPARGAQAPLLVPPGKEPEIDGNAGAEEWKDALVSESPGLTLRILHGPTHLFLRLEAGREGRFASGAVHLHVPPLDRVEFAFPPDRLSLAKVDRFFLFEIGDSLRGVGLRSLAYTRPKGLFAPDGGRAKAGDFVRVDRGERRAEFERSCGWVAAAGEAGGRPCVEFRVSFWRIGVDPCSGSPDGLRLAAAMAVEPAPGKAESASWPAKGSGAGWRLDLVERWRGEGILEAAVKPRDGWVGAKPSWIRDPARLRGGVLRFLARREGTLGELSRIDLGAEARAEAERFLAERVSLALEAGPRAAALEAAAGALAPAGRAVRIVDFRPGPPGESLAEACALWELGLHKLVDRLDASLRVRAWNALADLEPGQRKVGERRSMTTFDASMDWVGGAPGFGFHVLTLYEKDGRIRAQARVQTGTWFSTDDRIVVITGSESIGAPGIQDGFAMYDPEGRELACRRDFRSLQSEGVKVFDGRFFFITGSCIVAVDREGRELFSLPCADELMKSGGFLVTVAWTDPGFTVRAFADDGRALGEHRTRGSRPRVEPSAAGDVLTLLVDGQKVVFRK